MKKRLILFMAAALLPLGLVAHALVDAGPNGCRTIRLCNAKAANGDCGYVASGGDGLYTHHVYSDASAATAVYTATVCMSHDGSQTTCNELSPTITVTNAATQNYWDGTLKNYWAKVSGYSGSGGVTVYDYTCPASKP